MGIWVKEKCQLPMQKRLLSVIEPGHVTVDLPAGCFWDNKFYPYGASKDISSHFDLTASSSSSADHKISPDEANWNPFALTTTNGIIFSDPMENCINCIDNRIDIDAEFLFRSTNYSKL